VLSALSPRRDVRKRSRSWAPNAPMLWSWISWCLGWADGKCVNDWRPKLAGWARGRAHPAYLHSSL